MYIFIPTHLSRYPIPTCELRKISMFLPGTFKKLFHCFIYAVPTTLVESPFSCFEQTYLTRTNISLSYKFDLILTIFYVFFFALSQIRQPACFEMRFFYNEDYLFYVKKNKVISLNSDISKMIPKNKSHTLSDRH